jgi:hypothetical protein
MDEPKDIYESFDKMMALCHEQIRLMGELKRALRMADLLGVPAKDIKGKLRAGAREGHNRWRPWMGAVYTLQLDDGPVHEFPLIDVHKDLWSADIITAHKRWENRNKR